MAHITRRSLALVICYLIIGVFFTTGLRAQSVSNPFVIYNWIPASDIIQYTSHKKSDFGINKVIRLKAVKMKSIVPCKQKSYSICLSELPHGKKQGKYEINTTSFFIKYRGNKIKPETLTTTEDGWLLYEFDRDLYLCEVDEKSQIKNIMFYADTGMGEKFYEKIKNAKHGSEEEMLNISKAYRYGDLSYVGLSGTFNPSISDAKEWEFHAEKKRAVEAKKKREEAERQRAEAEKQRAEAERKLREEKELKMKDPEYWDEETRALAAKKPNSDIAKTWYYCEDDDIRKYHKFNSNGTGEIFFQHNEEFYSENGYYVEFIWNSRIPMSWKRNKQYLTVSFYVSKAKLDIDSSIFRRCSPRERNFIIQERNKTQAKLRHIGNTTGEWELLRLDDYVMIVKTAKGYLYFYKEK